MTGMSPEVGSTAILGNRKPPSPNLGESLGVGEQFLRSGGQCCQLLSVTLLASVHPAILRNQGHNLHAESPERGTNQDGGTRNVSPIPSLEDTMKMIAPLLQASGSRKSELEVEG